MNTLKINPEAKMKMLCMLLVALCTLMAVSGCNTANGVGQDIKDAGEAVKDATN